MVDVGGKPVTERMAVAEGRVRMSAEAFALVRDNAVAKGDVLTVARLAGIGGAKRTADLVPLCHPLPLDQVQVDAEADGSLPGVRIVARVSATARTGVEMEALTAVAVACLTVYDMVKAVDRGMRIEGIRLVSKSGGVRGDYAALAGDPEEE
jgi:cyclic pyranopterin phosphate synthase